VKHLTIGRMSLALLATAVVCLGQTAVASAQGNSGNAKRCHQGGWRTLARSDGSTFADEGACVSYAAEGGTLVPRLPDLVPVPNCTSSTTSAGCSVEVKNIGNAPAVGQIELQEALTMTADNVAGISGITLESSTSQCDSETHHKTLQLANPVITADFSVTCNNITIQPGATAPTAELDLHLLARMSGSPGTVAVTAAVVTPIHESNTKNNTFSQTFPLTGT
jgi:hypothetical protein